MNLRTVGAWITAGAAFWVSLGSLDVAVDGAQAVRVAMLPNLAQLAASLALALAVGAVLSLRLSDAPRAVPGAGGAAPGRSGDSFLPLYALSVLILPYLPWLPDRVPVLRVFAGPGRLLVWLVVASQVAWSVLGTGRGRRLVVRMRAWSALQSYLVVFAASAVLFGAASVALAPSGMFPGGDEPHYLIITQSLLTDHDLRIENNHARRDYAAYYDAELEPHTIAPGRDGGTYSVHPVGLPLLAAPAFALGGYPAVVLLMVLIAAAAAALAWRWVRRVTGSVAAATFSWSVTALSVPYLTNSGTVYPEIPAAFAVMVAATVAIRDVGLGDSAPGAATATPARAWRALLLGLATAVLPWLHAKYALLAAVLLAIGVWRIWRDRPPSPWTRERLVLAAAAPFALSVAAWLAFHFVIWGSPWPSAPYGGAAGTQMSARNLVRGVPGLLVDQEYGILPYAPALALGIVGLWSMWRAGGRARGLAIEIGLALAALVGTVGAFQMWWGGTALPGRMLVSGLLLTSLPVAWEFREGADRPERRAVYRLLLLVGLATSLAVLVVRNGATLALGRNGMSRFLEWLSPDWNLWAFAPDFIMQPTWLALAQAGIWLLAIAVSAWAVGLLAARGTAARGSSRTGRGLAFLRADAGALLAVLLVTIVMPPVLGGQPQAVPVAGRSFPHRHARVVRPARQADRHPLRPASPSSTPPRCRRRSRCRPGRGSRTARQPTPVLLNARFALPSGRYALELEPRAGAEGPGQALRAASLLQAGRYGGALTEWNVDAQAGGRWQGTFDLPVDVNFVGFRASAGLEAAVGELRVRPMRVVPTLDRVAATKCWRSLALDRFVFLFHDDASYPEPGGFWVRGAKPRLRLGGVETGRLTTKVRLRLRSPVANSVRFETPGLTWTTDLEAGVPAEIDVKPMPLDGTLRMTISPANGFRPSEVTPGSRDRRFLGCWVEVIG